MKDTKQIPEFHACLFDRLELTDGTTTLSQVRLRSNQLTKLIFYLIVYAETGCTAQQLINLLWDDNSENPANALKNLVYRIRKVLHGIWPDIDFIITRNGFYQWNPKVPIHTDIEEFMEYYNESKKLESTEARTTALESLTDVYKGKVLSDFGDDYDILCRQTYFQNMYLEAVNILSDIYEANEDFATMEQLCQKAILIDPLEESVHCCLLRSYIGEKRFAVAEQHYHDTVQLLNDNLGQEASDELRGIYEEMMKQQNIREMDLDRIKQDLKGGSRVESAFYCEYGVFKRIYELEARRCERQEMPISIALITLDDASREFTSSKEEAAAMAPAMNLLQKTLLQLLRHGDAITRYSSEQFLILLSNCSRENGIIVMERIRNGYFNNFGSGPVPVLRYSLEAVNA